jgi:hypothetical protein
MGNNSTKTSIWVFLAAFTLTFYGMGASFVESFVNYPTWRLVGANEFLAFHRALGPLIVGYMVIPMVIGTLLTALLIWFRPAAIPAWAIWVALVLQLINWASTVMIQVPIQIQLGSEGLSLPLIDRLIVTNFWFRKIPQIINAAIFLWLMLLMLRPKTEPSAEV